MNLDQLQRKIPFSASARKNVWVGLLHPRQSMHAVRLFIVASRRHTITIVTMAPEMEKKSKAANWSERETEILLSEISFCYGSLVSKFSSSSTVANKKRLWTAICETINTVGGQGRDVKICKKRWRDVRSAFLQK